MIERLFRPLYRGEVPGDGDPGGGGGEPTPTPAEPTPAEPTPGEPTPTPGEPTPAPGESAKTFVQEAPEDWRQQIAGDDEKKLKRLERYNTLSDFLDAGFAAQDRIRKGEIESGLPENPTEEQLAEWREANDVPAEAAGYELQLEEGLVLSEQDKEVLSGVYDVAHAENVSAGTMSKLTSAVLRYGERAQEQRLAQDGVDKQTTTKMLRETWGSDYESNINLAKAWIVSSFPETVRPLVESARLADGKAFFNSPEVMVAVADMMRKINPAATVVPNSNNPMQTITDEIASLEKEMGTPEWYKDTAKQKRYQELIAAQEQIQKQ